jgi:subtilase family serine protease
MFVILSQTRAMRVVSTALALVAATTVAVPAMPSGPRIPFVRSGMLSSNRAVVADAVVRDAIGRSPADRGIAATAAAHRGGYRDLGRYNAAAPTHLGILLRYQHEAELAQLTYLQGERSSPYYHRYLTTSQFDNYFAPSISTVQRIASEMQRRGFRVTRIFPNRTLINVTGTAASTERLFATELHRVYQASGHGYAYANVTDAKLPLFMKGSVVSVAGIHSTDVAFYPAAIDRAATARRLGMQRIPRQMPEPLAQRIADARVAAAATASPKPITTSTPAANPNPEPTLPAGATYVHGTMAGYGPVAFAASYDEPDMHGYAGLGQNIGNVISGDFADSDLKAQQAEFGVPRSTKATATRIPVDVYYQAAGNGSADDGESTLDVEAMLGLAYDANYHEYLVNTLADLSIEDGYNKVVSDDAVTVVNSSFGGCEQDDPSFEFATNYIAMQGTALGITFSASSGDTGGNGCDGVTNGAPGVYKGIEAPSADYYFVGVGGTDLVANPTTGARVAETGWETGGGGVSVNNSLPSWQAAAVAAATIPQTAGRNTPDVAFDASLETGYELYESGDSLTGGTSLASPIFCATQLMVNQVQGSAHGWINPRLYEIYAAQGSGFAIYDVLAGQNEDYVASVGYDDVTGLGALDGWDLAGTE